VSPLHNIAGLAGCAILLAAMAVWLAGRLRGKPAGLLAGAAAVASLVPLGGLPLAAYVRAFTGDLSMTTLLLLALFIAGRVRGLSIDPKEKFALLGTVALAALIFYPLALGMGSFDPYRLGYGNIWMILALAIVVSIVFSTRQSSFSLLALAIALSLAAWGVGYYESGNLWDYLLDAFLALYALGALVRRVVQGLLRRHRT
jgi:hypothetical protein